MNAEELGRFIAAQRRALGMTQADLGGMLDVTDKAVSKWERGLGFPDVSTLVPLADALQVSVDELMRADKDHAKEVPTVSDEAVINTIGIADEQLRRSERRSVIRSVVAIAVATLLVLVIDNADRDSLLLIGLVVYVPITCALTGVALLLRSYYLRRRREPFEVTLHVGLILVAVVIVLMLLAFLVGMLVFPGQQ